MGRGTDAYRLRVELTHIANPKGDKMRNRKYLGPVAGLGLSLLMAATVLATTTSGTWSSQPPGTNTPLMQNINSTSFSFWSCVNHNSDLEAYWDWMHHWPIIPSTGTYEQHAPCRNTTTKQWLFWSAGPLADYSVEYTHTNNSNVSTSWSEQY
jgi:hypothetical protein